MSVKSTNDEGGFLNEHKGKLLAVVGAGIVFGLYKWFAGRNSEEESSNDSSDDKKTARG